jgi:two-component system, NtrC family, sensor kinase
MTCEIAQLSQWRGICSDIVLNLSGARVIVNSEGTYEKVADEFVDEGMFRFITENVGEVISLHASDGTYRYVSPACLELNGYMPSELIGQSPYAFFHPDDLETIREKHLDLLAFAKDQIFTFRFRKKDGTYVWLETSIRAARTRGDSIEILAVTRSVEERMRQSQELARTHALLKTILDEIPLIVFLKDAREWNFVEVNKAYEAFVGMAKEDIVGKNDTAIYSRQAEEKFRKTDREIVSTGNPAQIEHRITLEGMGERILETRKVPLKDEYGTVTHILGVSQDVTAHRLLQEQLRQKDNQYRRISEAISTFITILDNGGIIRYASPSYSRGLGYDIDSMLSLPMADFIHPDDREAFREAVRGTLTTFEKQSLEHRLTRHDGSFMHVESAIEAIADDEGEWVIVACRDITNRVLREEERKKLTHELQLRNEQLEASLRELKNMQDTLVQSEKLASVGQLTAGIAHEINNPLSFISSNINRFEEYFDDANTLLERWKDFGEAARHRAGFESELEALAAMEKTIDLSFLREDFHVLLGHTRDGAMRIKTILDKLRGFVHISGDERTEADLSALIEDTLVMVHNELKYNATIVRDFGDLPPISCNVGEIKQVLINLLVNAGHAIHGHGSITLRTGVVKDLVTVEVSDTGEGIPPEYLNRIFDPFFTTKPVGKGTGLGLWISRSIVAKHGGTLSVKSTLGVGTTFTISLPQKRT